MNIIGAQVAGSYCDCDVEQREAHSRSAISGRFGLALSNSSGTRLTCRCHALFEMISTKLSTEIVDNFEDV